MKKLFVMVMVACGMTLVSCSGGSSSSSENDSDSVAVQVEDEAGAAKVNQDLEDIEGEIEEGVASGQGDAVLSSIAAYKAKIQALIKAGDVATAQKYIEKLNNFIKENQETINSVGSGVAESATNTVADLLNQVAAIPSDVSQTAKEVGENVVSETKEAATQKVNDVVEEGKAKTQEAVDAQKKKASDAIDKAASDVKGKLGL